MGEARGLTSLEAALLRDRLWVGGGLALLLALCWGWLVPAALDMQGEMDGLAAWMMAPRADWRYAAALGAMWAVMMAGMMLPSATPTLLLYGRVVRSQRQTQGAWPQVYLFGAGYLIVWTAFSALAAALQLALHQLAWITPMMRSANVFLTSALMIAAGVYQWLPLKRNCLAQCRSPAAFIAEHWRAGRLGALELGLRHGLYCLGCCWALMLLLFAGGVMSLACILGLTIVVLIEKFATGGERLARAGGALLVLAGLLLPWRS